MTYCKRFLLFTRTSYIHKYACCTVVSNTCIYTYIAYNFYLLQFSGPHLFESHKKS